MQHYNMSEAEIQNYIYFILKHYFQNINCILGIIAMAQKRLFYMQYKSRGLENDNNKNTLSG